MTFFVGFGAGALFMFVVMFALALMATAKDADDALARYFEAMRSEREVFVSRLDLPVPPRELADGLRAISRSADRAFKDFERD